MSESSSDTESSCGWTIISNEVSQVFLTLPGFLFDSPSAWAPDSLSANPCRTNSPVLETRALEIPQCTLMGLAYGYDRYSDGLIQSFMSSSYFLSAFMPVIAIMPTV